MYDGRMRVRLVTCKNKTEQTLALHYQALKGGLFRQLWGTKCTRPIFGQAGARKADQFSSSILLVVYERGTESRYTRLFRMCARGCGMSFTVESAVWELHSQCTAEWVRTALSALLIHISSCLRLIREEASPRSAQGSVWGKFPSDVVYSILNTVTEERLQNAKILGHMYLRLIPP